MNDRMASLKRGDDLTRLRKRVSIPALFSSGSWVAYPMGTSTIDIGPTTTQLLLWLPVMDGAGVDARRRGGEAALWQDVDVTLGQPGDTVTRTIPLRAATALLPPEVLEQMTIRDDVAVVTGRMYPAAGFENVFWKNAWAIGFGDGLGDGILVSLVSS